MRTLIVAVFLVAAALGVTVFAGYGDKPSQAYVTAPVERDSVRTLVKATGTVNAVVMLDVGSQLSGQVSEVLVNFNDPVKAGQVIARINPETFIAAVNEAKANLKIAKASAEVAEAHLAAARVQQDENQRNYHRYLALTESKSISDRDFTQSRAVRDTGAANLRALEGQLTTAAAVVEQKQAALEQAQLNLQRTEIRAPMDGIVIKRVINPGQIVAVSLELKTLFKIANDLSEMEVYGKIDEADVGQIKAGQPVTFTVDAYPDKVFSGRVLQVRKAPEISQNVVTYTAVASAPNPNHLLFPGMTARLQIVVDETEGTLKIPIGALRFQPNADVPDDKPGTALGSKKTVWVFSASGKPIPVSVTLGKSDESGTQLVSGNLAVGDRVIVGPAHPTETN